MIDLPDYYVLFINLVVIMFFLLKKIIIFFANLINRNLEFYVFRSS